MRIELTSDAVANDQFLLLAQVAQVMLTRKWTVVKQEITCYIVDGWIAAQGGVGGQGQDEMQNRADQIEDLEADEGPEQFVASVHLLAILLAAVASNRRVGVEVAPRTAGKTVGLNSRE